MIIFHVGSLIKEAMLLYKFHINPLIFILRLIFYKGKNVRYKCHGLSFDMLMIFFFIFNFGSTCSLPLTLYLSACVASPEMFFFFYCNTALALVCMCRGWKEELRIFSCDSHQPAGVLVFALKYLHIIKLLGKAWACSFSQKNLRLKEMGVLEALLGKMERKLKEMLYRYAGLSRVEKLHILELMLVNYTLRLSCGGICCFEDYMNKLNFVLCRVEYLHKEGSIELSHFVIELQNISCEIGNSEDGVMHKLDLLQNSLNLFSLKHIVLSGELKYLDAEVDVCDNDFQNPLPFIPGLPVGMPFEITLHNISSETRLWLAITLGEKSTQFVFLDLHEFGGCNEIRNFKFVAPFFRTPKVKHFLLKASIALECLSEDQHFKHCNWPRHELIHLCKGKEVHLSMAVR